MPVDDEMRRKFVELGEQMNEGFTQLGNRMTNEHESTRKTFALHASHIKRLWHYVKGSDPPPAPPVEGDKPAEADKTPSDPPVDELLEDHGQQISQHDMDIAGLQGQIIAFDTKHTKLGQELRDAIAQNNVAMGLTKRDPESVRRSTSIRQYATVIAAVTSLITALAGAYAAVTGHFPGQSPPPVPTVIITHESPR